MSATWRSLGQGGAKSHLATRGRCQFLSRWNGTSVNVMFTFIHTHESNLYKSKPYVYICPHA